MEKVVPDGKNILEKFHLITFMQDGLISKTSIKRILKLTILPTEGNVKLPGAGEALDTFPLGTIFMELPGFSLFS